MIIITPHLPLKGNARTRATFPTHKKNHNPHRGERGKGVKMGTLHWGGGGGPAKPGSYIYIYITYFKFLYSFLSYHLKVQQKKIE